MTIFNVTKILADGFLNFLKDKGIPQTDERLGEESLRELRKFFLPPLGYDGGISEDDAEELSRLVKKLCKKERDAGHCQELRCNECCITDTLDIFSGQDFDPDMSDDEEKEFFGRLMDAAEDWLENTGFTAADFHKEDGAQEDAAILTGDLYNSVVELFASLLYMEVPTDIAHAGQELPGEWTLTDDDSFQIRRKVEDGVYELYQVEATGKGDKFRVSHAVIYLNDYKDDIDGILDCYGYEDLASFKDEYRNDWEGVLAECAFETDCQNGECLIGKHEMTWKEAKAFICKLSGYQEED